MKDPRDNSQRCGNLNHGRWNVSINYCPDCGAPFTSRSHVNCSSQHHADFRRQRFKFCIDCGTKLNK